MNEQKKKKKKKKKKSYPNRCQWLLLNGHSEVVVLPK
jgi:hypothetical protein